MIILVNVEITIIFEFRIMMHLFSISLLSLSKKKNKQQKKHWVTLKFSLKKLSNWKIQNEGLKMAVAQKVRAMEAW